MVMGRRLPNRKRKQPIGTQWRFYVAIGVLLTVFAGLVTRAAYIQVWAPDRLRYEGDLRSLRSAQTEVQRGMMTDRNGRELAVSVPVQTVWADPLRVHEQGGMTDRKRWLALAEVFRTDVDELLAKVEDPKRRF